MTKTSHSIRTLSLMMTSVVALTALAACQTTGSSAQGGESGRQAKIDQAIERAANDADAAGSAQDSLALVEKLYKRNPKDASVATRYARALRNENRLTRANLVIEPFAQDSKAATAEVLVEYASIQTSMGNHAGAEAAARRAVDKNPESGKAYHVLGVALDAQGKHKPAEEAFRSGLEYWQGNPSPLLNNLGLNLAAQGFLDEAAETLRKAAATAPNRAEIERNLRIVNALQVSGGQVPSYLKQEEKDEEKKPKKDDAEKNDKKAAIDHDAPYVPPSKPHPAPAVQKASLSVKPIMDNDPAVKQAQTQAPVPTQKPVSTAAVNQ